MLHTFLASHRAQLIERCLSKQADRPARAATIGEAQNGVARFLDQLICTLEAEHSATPRRGRDISGVSGGEGSGTSEIGVSAARHGGDLFDGGVTVDHVVHEYGDLCQAITDLAFERHAAVEVHEFRTLNRCLDNAIAAAVTEFAQRGASR